MSSAIECRELVKRYGEVSALAGLDLSVARGEFFALLGPNGAGKSTLLQILATLSKPTSGRAFVFDLDTSEQAAAVRRRIGVVFQEPALDDRLSAAENLRIHAALYRIPAVQTKESVAEALEWAELAEVGRRPVLGFSGGMKRRLELVRALMHRPELLMMDEPTLGLDPQGRRHLWERIATLREAGLTVLMTTHNLMEAEACDRVGIIDRGRLVAVGTPRDLKAETVGSDEATLEDVFLTLTGRQLRDEEAGPRDRLLRFGRRGGEHTR